MNDIDAVHARCKIYRVGDHVLMFIARAFPIIRIPADFAKSRCFPNPYLKSIEP